MFGNLPPTEKQAFFTILDEYFESRPHLLGALQGDDAYSSKAAAASSPPPAPSRRSNPPPAPAARKPSVATPSSPTRNGPAVPAGLSSGKTFAGIKTSSTSAALGSMFDNKRAANREPLTAGDAIRGVHAASNLATRFNIGGSNNNAQTAQAPAQAQAPASAPAPAPPAPAAVRDLGQAEVLYDYKGTETDDLSVRQHDIVTLLEKVNDDWWKARASDGSGRSGLVPSSYVQVL